MRTRRLLPVVCLALGLLSAAACISQATQPTERAGMLDVTLYAQRPGEVFVVGHRAGGYFAPENTLAAIDIAVEVGVDGVELDVQRCATGEFVLLHDQTVERTTNGEGAVADLSLAELSRLRIEWAPQDLLEPDQFPAPPDSPRFQGLRVPTLRGALERVRGRLFVMLDLKADDAADVAREVAEADMLGDVLLKVNSTEEGEAVLGAAPDAQILARPEGQEELDEMLAALSPPVVHLDDATVTDENVARLHEAGIKIWVNTLGQVDVKAALSQSGPARLARELGYGELGGWLSGASKPRTKGYLRLRRRGADIMQTDNIVQLSELAAKWRAQATTAPRQ